MKYVIITSLFRPLSRGGAEVVVEDIVDELKKEHEVCVITTCSWNGVKSLSLTSSQENGLTVERFYPLNIFSFIDINAKPYFMRIVWHLLDMFNIHSYVVVLKYLKKNKPDCVLTHNLKGIGYLIPLAIKHTGIRHIHTLHDIQLAVATGLLYWKKEHEEKKIQNRFHVWCSRMLFGSPSAIVCPSHFLKAFYERRGFFPHSRYVVLSNPVCGEYPKHDVKTQTDIQNDLIRFFFAGTLNDAKGILLLCRTFTELHHEGIQLVIAGSGPDESEVKKYCERDNRIIFLGRLSHDALLETLRSMHYTIVPSLCYENAPTIIPESFSFGIPVIAADIGGTAESIQDDVNGFICAPGDPSALKHALNRAIHCGRYAELCKAARQSMQGRDCSSYVGHLIQMQKQ